MSLNCGQQRAFCSSPVTMQSWWNDTDRRKRRKSEKTCPSATLSTANPTWTDPGVPDERPATNCLSHGTTDEHHLATKQVSHSTVMAPWIAIIALTGQRTASFRTERRSLPTRKLRCNGKKSAFIYISHPDTRVKHGSI
jgi:hypothetical protein